MVCSQNMVFAGFGGQGVLFSGKLVAYAGLLEGLEVSWLPSYGPEMRGGTANCSVCLSDEAIGSPLVMAPDVLVALNQPSLDKFIESVPQGGIVLADSTMVQSIPDVEGVSVFAVPASAMAEEAGLKGLSNVVCVGKLFKEIQFSSKENLIEALKKCIPARKQDMLELNKQALEIGMQA